MNKLDSTTHWEGCATEGGRRHYDCAVARIRVLETERGIRPIELSVRDARIEKLSIALGRFVTAAKSWHDFHHGSKIVQCDWICELIPIGESALGLANNTEAKS